MSRLTDYFRDTRAEIKHVSWPTQRQAIVFTALVIVLSLVVAFLLGAFDFLFTRAIDWFIS